MMAVSNPLDYMQVEKNLRDLAGQLDRITDAMKDYEIALYERERELSQAEARANLANADDKVAVQKSKAVLATVDEQTAKDVAKAAYEHAKRERDALKVRIDIGRTLSSNIRVQYPMAGRGQA